MRDRGHSLEDSRRSRGDSSRSRRGRRSRGRRALGRLQLLDLRAEPLEHGHQQCRRGPGASGVSRRGGSAVSLDLDLGGGGLHMLQVARGLPRRAGGPPGVGGSSRRGALAAGPKRGGSLEGDCGRTVRALRAGGRTLQGGTRGTRGGGGGSARRCQEALGAARRRSAPPAPPHRRHRPPAPARAWPGQSCHRPSRAHGS